MVVNVVVGRQSNHNIQPDILHQIESNRNMCNRYNFTYAMIIHNNQAHNIHRNFGIGNIKCGDVIVV